MLCSGRRPWLECNPRNKMAVHPRLVKSLPQRYIANLEAIEKKKKKED